MGSNHQAVENDAAESVAHGRAESRFRPGQAV